MKKALCLMLCFILIGSMPFCQVANAANDSSLTFFEDFDNESVSYSKGNSSNTDAAIYDNVFNKSRVYDKSLWWDLTQYNELKDYIYDIEPMGDSAAFARISDKKNLYVITAFDIATIGTDKRPLYISLMNRKANKNHLRIIFQSGYIYLNSTAVADRVDGVTYSDSDMMNIQIVEQFSDDSGNKTEKVKAIYINGVNIINSDMNFYEQGHGDNFSRIRLFCAKKNSGDQNLTLGCFIDNLSVTEHIGIEDTLCDTRYNLLQAIKSAEKGDNENWDENIRNGITVYKNPSASVSEIESGTKKIQNAIYASEIKLKDVDFDTESGEVNKLYFSKNSLDTRSFDAYLAAYQNSGVLESCGIFKDDYSAADTAEMTGSSFEVPADSDDLRLFLWGNNLEPITKPIGLLSKSLNNWSIYVNGNLIHPDTPMCIDLKTKEIIVPIKNFLNNMGIELINEGTAYYANSTNGRSLLLYENSNSAMLNGTKATLKTFTYMKDGIVLMAPLNILSDTFGASISMDEENSRVDITYSVSNSYKALPSSIKLNCNPGEFHMDYSIEGIAAGAEVEVFYKLKQFNTERVESLYFQKALNPEKIGEKFIGAIGNLRHNHQYDILIKVVQGGTTNYYLKERAFQTKKYDDFSYEDMVSVNSGELVLVPTYENISYYLNYNADSCKIKYRKLSSSDWKSGLDAYKDPYIANCFRGSIVKLESNTEYEIRAEFYNESNVQVGILTQTVKTWNESPPIAKTVKLSEIYSGSGSLLLTNIKGSENGWIRIINDTNKSITGDKRCAEAILVSDCEYLILDGINISGGTRHGINITGSVKNIIVKNCDISNYGRAGIYNEDSNFYMLDGAYVDHDAGVYVCGAEKVTIDNCYIHDCNAYTNDWDENVDTHPFGGIGICYMLNGQGVIRNNRIIGNKEHMWNDAIEGLGNADRRGGPCRDTDIYNNVISGCNDDSTELDGGAMNIRFYNNRVDNAFSGISLAPILVGPVYMFNNKIVSEYGIKAGGAKDGYLGIAYIFNNTVVAQNHNLRNTGINGTSEFHSVTRNNVFFSAEGASLYNSDRYRNSRDSNRNDVLWGRMYRINSDDESYEFFAIPRFTDDYVLEETSVGKGKAEWIDNFNENIAGDIGCDFEY